MANASDYGIGGSLRSFNAENMRKTLKKALFAVFPRHNRTFRIAAHFG